MNLNCLFGSNYILKFLINMKPTSNMFFGYQGLVKWETGFTSKRLANEIISKTEETTMPFGSDVEKNNFKINKHSLFLSKMQFAITLLVYTTFLSDLVRKFIINQIWGPRWESIEWMNWCKEYEYCMHWILISLLVTFMLSWAVFLLIAKFGRLKRTNAPRLDLVIVFWLFIWSANKIDSAFLISHVQNLNLMIISQWLV